VVEPKLCFKLSHYVLVELAITVLLTNLVNSRDSTWFLLIQVS